jgi:type VI secretion system protein ImpC
MTDEPIPPDLEVNLPFPEGLSVTTSRPYRLLLISDLAGAEHGRLSGALLDRLVEVNADNFDELMAGAQPSLSFKITDPTASGSVMVAVDLRFGSLKDFQPDAILRQIPATAALLGVRDQIVARMRGKSTSAQLAAAVQRAASANPQLAWLPEAVHWTASAKPESDEAVDDLLGQIDLGGEGAGEAAKRPKTPIGKMVSAIATGGGVQLPAEEASALRRALAQIDQRAGGWLNAVLHAPAVQELEARWRALAFLVAHLDFRKGLRLSVLHAPREELCSRLITLVINPVFDAGAEAPDLLVVDALFGNTARDMEIVDELAQHAASLPVVALAGVSAEFFGVKHAWQVPTLPAFVSLFDQWQFAKWKTLRGQPYARSLGVVFGRGLLRAPYGRDGGDDLELKCREECLAEKDFVWASGAIAAACTIARSAAETGWPTGMVGRLEGFASALAGKKGDKLFGPADNQVPLEKAQDMAVAGLNAVICYKDETRVVVCNGFSAARPTRGEGYALLEVSLPYQLFASRLSSLLLDLKPHLVGLSQEKVAAVTLAHVRDWLTVADVAPEDQQVAVQARPLEGHPESLQLAVTVTPPPRILPGGVPIVLGYRLR